jgi:hypothetical protein
MWERITDVRTLTTFGEANHGNAPIRAPHGVACNGQTPASLPAKLEKECRWRRDADGGVTLFFGKGDL